MLLAKFMGASIEILPTKPLSPNWEKQLCDRLVLINETITLDTRIKDSYRVIVNQSSLFGVWLSIKERSISPDEEYIEGIKWLEKIKVPLFMEQFRKIDYSIRLEIRRGTDDEDRHLMIMAVKEMVRQSNGIALFDHDFCSYKHHHVYLLSDFE